MEFENVDANEGNKKATLALGAVILTVVVLAVVTYMFFYSNEPSYDNSDVNEIALPAQVEPTQIEPTINAESSTPSVEIMPDSALADSAPIAPMNAESTPAPAVLADSAPTKPSSITSLKYTIKPNDMDIFSCTNFKNGRWDMPKNCAGAIVSAVQRLIDNNAELIALEVSGIVDNNPYSGPSAELKQEGLASFRAREGIIAILRNFTNVAAFEGPSMQMNGKRGFQVKAYYLQK